MYMARSYTQIKQYYEEMERLHQEGHSCREIGEKFGFTKEQVKECLRRPRRKAQKQEAVFQIDVGDRLSKYQPHFSIGKRGQTASNGK